MSPLRHFAADQVRAALPMRDAIAAMRDAFSALARGAVDMPVRTALPFTDGATLLVMPARCKTPPALCTKLVTVTPRNSGTDVPVVQATVVLFDPANGAPIATLDGTSLTAIRTGAASGLATDLFARSDATRVAILGAGAQARTQLDAVRCVRDIKSVAIWSRTRARAERFSLEIRGVDVRVATSVANAARDADIIACATSAAEPVLGAGDVAPGTHVNAVGSFTPEMREFDAELLGHARVVVDQRDAALAEAGEIIAAVNARIIVPNHIAELGAIGLGKSPERQTG